MIAYLTIPKHMNGQPKAPLLERVSQKSRQNIFLKAASDVHQTSPEFSGMHASGFDQHENPMGESTIPQVKHLQTGCRLTGLETL